MSAETSTVDLTTVRRAAARLVASAHARKSHQGRHRRPVDTDRRAAKGIAVLLLAGAVLTYAAGAAVGVW